MPDSIVGRRSLHKGWLDVEMLTLRQGDGGTVEREVVIHPAGAAVLPYDPDRQCAMFISESRPGLLVMNAPPQLEAIAGALDDDAPEDCARREALEEAGVRLEVLERVSTFFPTPPTSTEQVHAYLAPYRQADLVAEGGGLEEERERLSVVELPLDRAWAMVERMEICDAKTLILLQALRLRRPELFGREDR